MDRWEYNSCDCLATSLIFVACYPLLGEQEKRIYEAEMGLQGAFLGVQMRGILVDKEARREVLKGISSEIAEIDAELGKLLARPVARGTVAKFESYFNPQSPDQIKALLYDELGLAPQYDRKTKKVTTGESALGRIARRTVAIRH